MWHTTSSRLGWAQMVSNIYDKRISAQPFCRKPLSTKRGKAGLQVVRITAKYKTLRARRPLLVTSTRRDDGAGDLVDERMHTFFASQRAAHGLKLNLDPLLSSSFSGSGKTRRNYAYLAQRIQVCDRLFSQPLASNASPRNPVRTDSRTPRAGGYAN
uniref:Uncharacterized protein n=1 Tax=Mycena chlorophos TaxID=658473 RepID=A0ABQ0LJQ5_MYCCL|nr:predicted protein [Mycena chlorophos]